ncbi:MAG: hypothetical protein ACHQ53_19490 [Polyangiales bacterium]
MRRGGLALPGPSLAMCCALLALGTGACKSAAQKCAEARAAAHTGWNAYVTALEGAQKAALQAQSESHRKLSSEIEHRLGPAVQKLADARYPRSSSAWLRAYQSAYHDACARDPECSALTERGIQAKATLDDFRDRLPLAKAALEASDGAAETASSAAKAAIVHPDYPQLKKAQLLSATAYQRCKDLPPPSK